MANPALMDRMRTCLGQHIECYERMVGELASLEQEIREGRLDLLEERQRLHAGTMRTLEEELRLLMREWGADASVDEAERTEISAMARRAEELTRELSTLHRRGYELAQEQLARIAQALAETRKGRGLLEGYRAGDGPEPQQVDRKA